MAVTPKPAQDIVSDIEQFRRIAVVQLMMRSPTASNISENPILGKDPSYCVDMKLAEAMVQTYLAAGLEPHHVLTHGVPKEAFSLFGDYLNG